jgi:hypothetical protein
LPFGKLLPAHFPAGVYLLAKTVPTQIKITNEPLPKLKQKQKCMLKVIIWGPACCQKHRAGAVLLPQAPLKTLFSIHF